MTISDSAFERCEGLERVEIEDGVMAIEVYAFKECFWLESITIPDSVIRIGEWAFNECDILTSIQYKGTKRQWASINFPPDKDWFPFEKGLVVHCKDGDITL